MLPFLSAHWLWLAAGLGLLAFEALLPGIFLFWVGLAALGTGLVVFVLPLSMTAQLVIFALLALASILLGRRIQTGQKADAPDAPHLNNRGAALIGQTLPLETPILHGVGSVRIGDSVWRVTGSDAEQGHMVRVVRVDGSTLCVEPVS